MVVIYLNNSIVALEGEQAALANSHAVQSD